MNPFDIFDQVYCFNLPNASSRKQQMNEQFKRFGVEGRVIYLSADRPPKGFTMSNMRRAPLGEFGVNLTQMKGIIHAIHAGARCPIFFEDDIIFADDTEERLSAALTELPSNWNMLYLGGHPRGPLPQYRAEQYSKNLVKLGRHSFADSYAFNNKDDILLAFADEWLNRISQPKAMYDIILGDFAGKHEAFCVYPILCNQRVGVSSISGKHDDKRPLLKKAWSNHLS